MDCALDLQARQPMPQYHRSSAVVNVCLRPVDDAGMIRPSASSPAALLPRVSGWRKRDWRKIPIATMPASPKCLSRSMVQLSGGGSCFRQGCCLIWLIYLSCGVVLCRILFMANDFRLDDYLARIGFKGTIRPATATLAALHAAHVDAIPFEDLDPLLRRPVKLNLPQSRENSSTAGAARYCFEQNTLFRAALEAIGFKVTALGGRVRWMSPPDAPLGPRTHMLQKVDLPDGPYLADVGFGACVLDTPLQFKTDVEQRRWAHFC